MIKKRIGLLVIMCIICMVCGMERVQALTWGGDLTHDPKFDQCERVYGIDVSYYQEDIDWEKVKASGIEFAILRLGYRGYSAGTLVTDSRFHEYIKGAHKAGLELGVYFYTRAISKKEAKEEAEYVIKVLKDYPGYLSFPVYYDMEDAFGPRMGTANLTTADRTAFCVTFCDTIKAAGYDAGVYSNCEYFTYYLDKNQFKTYNNWFAKYSTSTIFNGDYFEVEYNMWQFGGGEFTDPKYPKVAKVPGIGGENNADLNVFYRARELPKKVTGLKQTKLSDSAVEVEWDSLKQADGYQLVLYDVDGNKLRVKKTQNNTYKWTRLQGNTKYKTKVRPYYLDSEGKISYGDFTKVIAIYTKPAKVEGITQTANSSTTATITWSKVPIASGYRICSYDEETQEYTTIGTTTQNTFKVTGLELGIGYPIAVQAYVTIDGSAKKFGVISDVYQVTAQLEQVSEVKSIAQTPESVTLTWKQQEKVDGYEINCYDVERNLIETMICNSAEWTKEGLKSAKEYLFEVRSFASLKDGTKVYGAFSEMYSVTTLLEQVKGMKADICNSKSIVLSWEPVAEAVGYQIYSYDCVEDRKTPIQTVDTAGCTITGLVAGNEYSYVVVAYQVIDNEFFYGVDSDVYKVATKPAKVTDLVYKSSSTERIKIQWSKSGNAKGYEVDCLDEDGNLIETRKITETVYVWKNLASSSKYFFVVRAYMEPQDGVRVVGANSAKVAAVTRPSQVLGLKAGSIKKNSVRISWKKVARAQGYGIYQYNEKTGKCKLIATTGGDSYTVKNLKAATAYSLYVKAYIKSRGVLIYGEKSKNLKVKTKK